MCNLTISNLHQYCMLTVRGRQHLIGRSSIKEATHSYSQILIGVYKQSSVLIIHSLVVVTEDIHHYRQCYTTTGG